MITHRYCTVGANRFSAAFCRLNTRSEQEPSQHQRAFLPEQSGSAIARAGCEGGLQISTFVIGYSHVSISTLGKRPLAVTGLSSQSIIVLRNKRFLPSIHLLDSRQHSSTKVGVVLVWVGEPRQLTFASLCTGSWPSAEMSTAFHHRPLALRHPSRWRLAQRIFASCLTLSNSTSRREYSWEEEAEENDSRAALGVLCGGRISTVDISTESQYLNDCRTSLDRHILCCTWTRSQQE